ncbi:hypothetical protein EV580_0020 [Mycobacterium sp. BK086]|uniref:hypothetical protein n=1 Tax=Mycobacterium sp. BK086 TaxID=2512165 RepID=UPI00105BFF44|nr:hypothetical protein [Mycobacterium sp. BK086]TDO16858.1 hypothetical protein EV580_0020 [Mycobacterium sp. BK086]
MTRRSAGAALLTVVAVALAALIWHNLPTQSAIYAPFDVHAGINTAAVGENLSGTVTGASIASIIEKPPSRKPVTAAGTWLVAATSLEATTAPVLPHADLLVGPNTYAPTDRLLSTNGLVQPGLALHCAWVFDVPIDLLNSVTSVVLRVWGGDERLDSRLVIDVPLGDASVTRPKSIVVEPAQTVAR